MVLCPISEATTMYSELVTKIARIEALLDAAIAAADAEACKGASDPFSFDQLRLVQYSAEATAYQRCLMELRQVELREVG
jgi:hypothetical protein